MKNKHRAFLLADSLLSFFLLLQALIVLPCCIIPLQQKLHAVQQEVNLKIAVYQKLNQEHLETITLNNQVIKLHQRGNVVEAHAKKQYLHYDLQTKTFRFYVK